MKGWRSSPPRSRTLSPGSRRNRESSPLPDIDADDVLERIWERDPTVWTGRDEAQWLGWLDEPLRMRERIEELGSLAEGRSFERVVVCGMGGSSLAPLVFGRLYGAPLDVLDTTHPAAVRRLELDGTLFVISSKSGTTVETRCHFDYLWERLSREPLRFLVVTDPGSPLEELARERGVRTVSGEPTIGGRYSALSAIGLAPAALAGIDLDPVLAGAETMHDACRIAAGNPGLELGVTLGEAWRKGRDKVVFDDVGGFGLWLEQLVAESTGKQGKGLVPVPGGSADGDDRIRVELEIDAARPEEVGAEWFRCELAVAVAGAYLGVNPFDQPDVEDAKEQARALLASGQRPFRSSGTDPGTDPGTVSGTVSGTVPGLLASAEPGDYVAIQAYVDPARQAALQPLLAAAEATGCAVTVGLGPRYLHSTGQLHKGGPPNGLFVQVLDETGEDVAIPGRKFTFGRLLEAQAAGDYETLVARGRRVARVKLEDL